MASSSRSLRLSLWASSDEAAADAGEVSPLRGGVVGKPEGGLVAGESRREKRSDLGSMADGLKAEAVRRWRPGLETAHVK